MNNIRFKSKFRIPSSRLPNWDYSSSGWYYVTICTKNRICYFGDIFERKMQLSETGRCAKKFWKEIPYHFKDVKLDEYNILPDHIHGIIIINHNVETCHGMSLQNKFGKPKKNSLGIIINQFKSAVTRWCYKNGFINFSWQSRFYDHIVRDEQTLFKIRDYIRNNHLKWDDDEENPKNIRKR
ncbi:transposase [Candidatus Roizmanbacteria bacterium]|nr:transposase [Candidatus Roizmanbacteria bacterium]